MNSPLAVVVMITTGSREEATRIAEHLVEMRIAACVQILPGIESIYRWKGKIERSEETLLLAKTTQDKFEKLEAAVRSLHSYDTPEIMALPVSAVSDSYFNWLMNNVSE